MDRFYDESMDYEGGKECAFCGKPMSDLSDGSFCSKDCKIAEIQD